MNTLKDTVLVEKVLEKKGVTNDSDYAVSDDLPPLVRNQITILLGDEVSKLMLITIENVNKYNLQPCRFLLI